MSANADQATADREPNDALAVYELSADIVNRFLNKVRLCDLLTWIGRGHPSRNTPRGVVANADFEEWIRDFNTRNLPRKEARSRHADRALQIAGNYLALEIAPMADSLAMFCTRTPIVLGFRVSHNIERMDVPPPDQMN